MYRLDPDPELNGSQDAEVMNAINAVNVRDKYIVKNNLI